MTEYQGYRTKAAHDIAVLQAAVNGMVVSWDGWKNVGYVTDEAHTFTADNPISNAIIRAARRPDDRFTIKWRDPSPIAGKSLMESVMADIERTTERQTRAMRFYSNAIPQRFWAGMP